MTGFLDYRQDRAVYQRQPFCPIVMGIVVDNKDPEKMGRVKVQVPSILGVQDESQCLWAMPSMLFEGQQFIPRVKDPVWIMFQGGDLSKPVYVGTWYRKDVMPDPEALHNRHYLYYRKLKDNTEHKFYVEPEKHEVFLETTKKFRLHFKEKEILLQNKEMTGKVLFKDDGSVLVDPLNRAVVKFQDNNKTKSITFTFENSGLITVESTSSVTLTVKSPATVNLEKPATVNGKTIDINAEKIQLNGGSPVARLGDEVTVTVPTHGECKGLVTSGSSNVNAGG